jgi:hypothetical protein
MSDQVLQLYINVTAILSGILFWAGFLVFGFIAKRYHVVFNKTTFHGLLMTAPSGILAYSVLMIIKSSMLLKDAAVNNAIQLTAYGFLLASAVLCLFAIIKFSGLIDELLKYKG